MEREVEKIQTLKFDWIKVKENGNYIVSTKVGDIELQEQDGEVLESAMALAEKIGKDPSSILLMRSIVDKEKYDDRTILKLPGSVYFKLKAATAEIYGLRDFLEKQE